MVNFLGFLGSVFIPHPWVAFIPALVFGLLYLTSKRRAIVIASAAWAVYACYEYGMYRRWLCGGECNIRVDLLLVYPVLILVSVLALVLPFVSFLRRARGASGSGAAP